ncbi:MAG: RnfABCDGE type electron transport complex subunit B [Spirochaetaceae bacterium]|jgi:Na+-translocating ferredoxin:NAD+ oxidoreductase RNF subunit RnfB|nr:RnfABCDGE type electron transport complex subunit B [Spirochaetaceae bacterium]
MSIVLITAVFAAVLAFVLGTALGFFRQVFAVTQDPLAGQIREALPGANCGACGYPGCDAYASAVAKGEAGIAGCSVGGPAAAKRLAALVGGDAEVVPVVAVLACRGSKDRAPEKGEYTGVRTCRGAKLSAGGTKLCAWGCLGFGDCAAVCKFGALSIGENGLPRIDKTKCTGCKICTGECPQGVLRAVPRDQEGSLVFCSNRNPVRAMVMKTCKAGCIKCGLCVKNCPRQCIVMDNGIPLVDYGKCDSCGTCVSKCPTKVFNLLRDAQAV